MLMSNWAFKDWTHETKTKFFPTKQSNKITIACTRMNRMNSRRKPQYDCISSTDKVKLKDYRWLTVLRSKLEIERKCIGDVLRKAYGLIVDVACVSFGFSRYMSSTHVCEWVSRVCWSILCKKMERKRERQETTKTPTKTIQNYENSEVLKNNAKQTVYDSFALESFQRMFIRSFRWSCVFCVGFSSLLKYPCGVALTGILAAFWQLKVDIART